MKLFRNIHHASKTSRRGKEVTPSVVRGVPQDCVYELAERR